MARGTPKRYSGSYRNLIENALAHAPGETAIDVVAGPGPK